MKLAQQCLFASIFLALTLRADVTIRYQSEIKPAAALQPMLEPFLKNAQLAPATSIRMKGNKGYTTAGNWIEIFDYVKQEVTLLDPEHKTFATLPLSQLGDKLAGAVPQGTPEQMQAAEKALAGMQTKVDSKMTGKTAEILGIRAEEREVTLSMSIPMPAGKAPSGIDMSTKMVMHIWTAQKEEALRVPAIRELTGYQAWQKYVMNPGGMLEKLAGKMPGMATAIGPLMDEMSKNQSVILRTHMEIYVPFLAMLAKQMAAQGQKFPALDPDAPMMEMNQEVAELSSAPVDASLFEIPADYKAGAADDILQGMIKARQ
jgi:hypothetical protein